MAKIQVYCSAPSGVFLQIHDMVEGPLGIKYAKPRGERVMVPRGVSLIEESFFTEWLKQNPDENYVRRA